MTDPVHESEHLPPDIPRDVLDLLIADRELTSDEQARLRAYGQLAMHDTVEAARAQAAVAFYNPRVGVDQFARCVFDHLPEDQLMVLVRSDIYTCPRCGVLLKDRG